MAVDLDTPDDVVEVDDVPNSTHWSPLWLAGLAVVLVVLGVDVVQSFDFSSPAQRYFFTVFGPTFLLAVPVALAALIQAARRWPLRNSLALVALSIVATLSGLAITGDLPFGREGRCALGTPPEGAPPFGLPWCETALPDYPGSPE